MLPAPTAYLRVYEPLSSFPDSEREAWASYASGAGGQGEQAQGEQAQEAEAAPPGPGRAGGQLGADPALATMREFEMLAVALVRPAAVADVDDAVAFVLEHEGQTMICPWRTRLRAIQTVQSFRESVAEPVAEAFCPEDVAELLTTELEGWRRLHPGQRSHILSSTWSVPVRWFVAFEPVERSVLMGTGLGRAMVYRADMSRVRRRVSHALTILRQAFGNGGPTSEVEVLERWLDQFHPRSLVELDYGRVVDFLDDEAMRSDESAADVMDSLDALSQNDVERAGEAYERVVGRWQPLASRERAS